MVFMTEYHDAGWFCHINMVDRNFAALTEGHSTLSFKIYSIYIALINWPIKAFHSVQFKLD